jgi:hypothetical protein
MRIPGPRGLAARNQMQLIVLPYFQPYVSIILERIGNNLRANNLPIKRRALLQIRHIQRDVIEVRLITAHSTAI